MKSTRRGSFSVHRSEKNPGSKYISTSGLSPRGHLERQAASDYQLQEAKKKILIGPYSCVGGSPCPYTLGLAGSPQPSSCTTFMLNSHQGRAAIGKKNVLHLCAQGCFGHVQLFATLYTVACQASLSGRRGVLQARTLECIGQYCLP